MTASPVVAIVVNYNAAELVGACLDSLRANGVDTVIVVDNGSADGSAQVVRGRGGRWVPTGANIGYGGAANRGATAPEARAARFLVVGNPDLELGPGAVDALVASLDADPGLGIVGPSLWNDDGSLYPSARTFPDLVDSIGHGLLGMIAPANPFTRRYRLLDWDHRRPARVDWVSGACFVVRREAWDEVNGFDPAYFMYMEDVDLCWRLHQAGWAIGYEPEARVRHIQGGSTNRHPYRMLAAHHRSMWRFAWRTTSGSRRAALPVVAAGLAARLALAIVDHRLGRSHRPKVPAGGPVSSSRPSPEPERAHSGRFRAGPTAAGISRPGHLGEDQSDGVDL